MDKKKSIFVAWKFVCKPFEEGGLDLKSMVSIKSDAMLKLGWVLSSFDSILAKLLWVRVCRNDRFISSHISSSIWSGIKNLMPAVTNNSSWLIGNGNLNFWNENWIGSPIVDLISVPYHLHCLLMAKGRDFWSMELISLPSIFVSQFLVVSKAIKEVVILVCSAEDKLAWHSIPSGSLSSK